MFRIVNELFPEKQYSGVCVALQESPAANASLTTPYDNHYNNILYCLIIIKAHAFRKFIQYVSDRCKYRQQNVFANVKEMLKSGKQT